jgi:hypothetical protein
MKTEISYAIWPRDLDFGEVFGRIESFANKRNMKVNDFAYLITIDVDSSETISAHSLEEFLEVYKSLPRFDQVTGMQCFAGKGDELLMVNVSSGGRFLEVSVDCRNADIVRLLQEQLRSDFRLQKAPLPPPDKRRATYPQPRLFLGRHFDERAAGMARKLKHFLSLLGIDVTEGEQYTAQSIPAKVMARIDAQDIYLGLVTVNPEHDWLIAEGSYARGKGKHIILIAEEGAKFNPTILGRDFEQIRFAGTNIEQGFIKLLQEFRDIGLRVS